MIFTTKPSIVLTTLEGIGKIFNFLKFLKKKYKQFWISTNLMYSRSLNYQWDLEDYSTPYYSPGNDVNNFHIALKLAYLIPLAN